MGERSTVMTVSVCLYVHEQISEITLQSSPIFTHVTIHCVSMARSPSGGAVICYVVCTSACGFVDDIMLVHNGQE